MSLVSHPVKEEMFLTTPVENLFIHEAMGAAPGDYVKVYLFGLMLCHSPSSKDVGVAEMAEALHLSGEDIRKAYEYWARRHLVEILQADPLQVSYLSVQQHLNEARLMEDLYQYESLFRKITDLLGSEVSLSRSDLERIYEWMEDLHLDEEAVLTLVEHCVLTCREKGRKPGMAYMNKVAGEWAQRGLTTAEAATEYLRREDQVYQCARELLRRWGLHRAPTQDDLGYCQKWLLLWNMEPGALYLACQRMSAAKPNFRYLDTLVQEMHDNHIRTTMDARLYYTDKDTFAEELKAVLKALGYFGSYQAELPKSLYKAWKDAGYAHDAILTAARQLARKGSNRLEDLDQRVKLLAREGRLDAQVLKQEEDTLAGWRQAFGQFLPLWAEDRTVQEAEGRRYGQWLAEGHSPEMILAAAKAANHARDKLSYIDKLLSSWRGQGITRPQDIPPQSTQAPQTQAQPGIHFGHERKPDGVQDIVNDWDAPI